MTNKEFTFAISLSVLNHLGRNLYRSFMTVIGEAVSNSWDADAENVWIYIDREKNYLVIKDDGHGMDADDFQYKFLKIGYSKRKDGKTKSDKNRPYIGRKGIGKLALLSCAKKVTIISKKIGKSDVGGVIDNNGLDDAIKHDLEPDEYVLQDPKTKMFDNYLKDYRKGTIVFFEDLNEEIKHTIEYIKISIALFFRFSLIDRDFSIFVNDEEITIDHLSKLADNTQFLWIINKIDDPYIEENLIPNPNLEYKTTIQSEEKIRGFIASVEKPSQLKISNTNEKVSIDLFVNGRLREKNLIKHIPTARLPENYIYGQIHFDELDEEIDRFTTSREAIKSDDPKFATLLFELRNILRTVIDDWDNNRVRLRQDGDSENRRITKKERKARELFNATSQDYSLPTDSKNKQKVDEWVGNLEEDAQFNFSSYAECFISENLVRKYIEENEVKLSDDAKGEFNNYKRSEEQNKKKGGLSIEIRQSPTKLSYLGMDTLSKLVDQKDPLKEACLIRDACEYKPMRDAIAHTAKLTDIAKQRLTTVFENIKARVMNLLSKQEKS